MKLNNENNTNESLDGKKNVKVAKKSNNIQNDNINQSSIFTGKLESKINIQDDVHFENSFNKINDLIEKKFQYSNSKNKTIIEINNYLLNANNKNSKTMKQISV